MDETTDQLEQLRQRRRELLAEQDRIAQQIRLLEVMAGRAATRPDAEEPA